MHLSVTCERSPNQFNLISKASRACLKGSCFCLSTQAHRKAWEEGKGAHSLTFAGKVKKYISIQLPFNSRPSYPIAIFTNTTAV